MNVNDISNEIQESVNQVLSFSKMNSSQEMMIMDTSFSSLSSGHDFISDYQSTSGSEANISRLSHSSQNSLSLSKEEDEQEREERRTDEIITELEENSNVPVAEQREQQQPQPVESFSEELAPVCATLRSFSTDSTIPEDGEDNEIIVNNNLINKRRKLSDNRRKSISVLKRVNNNIHPEMMMNSSERETGVPEQSTVTPATANDDIFVDDIMLTLEPPKISDEPDMQPNNPKKRRASNLPVPTLSIQTRAMRRQSLSAIATSLDQITSNLPPTPTLTSLSMPVIKETQKEAKGSNNHKITGNQEPITVSGIASSSSSNTNDENAVVHTEKKTPANKRGKIPLAPSNQQNISTPAITVDLLNKPKGSSNGKKSATKNSSPFSNNDENIDLFADINIDWLSGGDQQPSVKKNTTKSIKPVAKKYQEIQNAIDFTNIQVVDENNPNSVHVHPPSPTRKETRRMSISNRRTSLAKVNAMLDSVTSLLVEPVTSSVSAVSASAARLTTRSMR
jgi:hypothetical protein